MNNHIGNETTSQKTEMRDMKEIEKFLIHTLIKLNIIHPNFTGTITFHISRGGLSDIDRFEKSLKRSQNLYKY